MLNEVKVTRTKCVYVDSTYVFADVIMTEPNHTVPFSLYLRPGTAYLYVICSCHTVVLSNFSGKSSMHT